MTLEIKHKFESELPDGSNGALVQPSNWNDTHDITMATGKVLGRSTAGTGPVEELDLTGLFATTAQGAKADTAVQPGDIGTAAAEDVGYFATAAQGALADTALQPAAIGVTVQGYDADLSAVAALASTGLAARTASNTWAQRAVAVSGAGLSVSNGDGVSGNPTLSLADDVAAIEALTPSNDDVLQRKSGAWTNRSISQFRTDLDLGSIYQPLDSDLTAIAALTTTSFGRSVLEAANAAGLFGTIKQAATESATGVVELATAAETKTGTDTERAVTPAGLASFYRHVVLTINDDAVGSVTINADRAWVIVNTQNLIATTGSPKFMALVMTNHSSAEIHLLGSHISSSNVTLAIGSASAPTGTTGTDGQFTITPRTNARTIHFENRSGGTRTVNVVVLCEG